MVPKTRNLGPDYRRLKQIRFRTLSRMVREGPAEPAPPPQEPYPAEKARGGEIVLRTPARKVIFLAGLVGALLLALVIAFAR